MTAPHILNPARVLDQALSDASPEHVPRAPGPDGRRSDVSADVPQVDVVGARNGEHLSAVSEYLVS